MIVRAGSWPVLAVAGLALAIGFTRLPVAAQTPPVPVGDPQTVESGQAALESVENSIGVSKERAAALKREIEEMSGDRAKQNAALIAAGQRLKLAEIEVASMEERLGELIVAELEVRGRLDGADANIANVLAALERISRNPPPALIVDPSDALGSARSALLIAAILPQLRVKADQVIADLKHLSDIKAQALREEALLKANLAILEEEQLRIATLIAARKQGVEIASAQLAAEEREAEALAARAKSLKELVAALTQRVSAVNDAARAAPNAVAGTTALNMTSETARLAFANTARVEPAIPFTAARGHLTLPVGGVNVIEFGAGDGFGGISQGLSIATRAEAQVLAPADGWVLYQGPYLNYGQIIIINPGQDYTILLAGLDSVAVKTGQFVLMGEPVGTMGSQTIGEAPVTSAGVARPTLYIEMRKNNEPVDPTGWWAPQNNPTQSG